MKKDFYFSAFEDRKPEIPLENSPVAESLWQFFGTIALCLGFWYLHWRWTASLNFDALWYSLPLVIAETGAYIGLVLFTFNLWKVEDEPILSPPIMLSEITGSDLDYDRPITIDIFFPTYDEEPELVRLSILDAKKVRLPDPSITVAIHVLDDGSREEMQKVAEEEGVNYITRPGNDGFKAGNLRNAMQLTTGDLILICDADTRPFVTFLENTMGYFRDPKVAWVQTPQWFYDLPEGKPLPDFLKKYLGTFGKGMGHVYQFIFGKIQVGSDPFVSDPKLFYDVILRRRNWVNAAFCCGAGSIHRRDAVMKVALQNYGEDIQKDLEKDLKRIKKITKDIYIDEEIRDHMTREMVMDKTLAPYKYHVSEDIYTSMVLHGDKDTKWRSIQHPEVESKMLSPQDLLSWSVQRFKYAGGTLDIALNDNPVLKKGMSLPQKIMYGATIWSYLGGLWNIVFLISPIIYLASGLVPINADMYDFYIHFIPFIIINEIATMFSMWGLSNYKAKSSFISFFWVNLRAIATVVRGKEIKFPVTPKQRQEGNHVGIVWPHVILFSLSIFFMIFAVLGYSTQQWGDYQLGALIFNLFWATLNALSLIGIITAAFWKPEND